MGKMVESRGEGASRWSAQARQLKELTMKATRNASVVKKDERSSRLEWKDPSRRAR